MAKTKISEFNSNPALNTDIDSINLAEGCAPSGINDAIRELMSQLKDWQSGTSNDPMVIGSSGSLTLNQGTANGVAYLNGSKVVTSGSALTFDGTTFAQTGANGIPIRIQELASVPTSQTAAYIGVSTSAFPGSNNGDLILAPRTSGGNLIKFYTGNGTSAERYSIDSIGVATWSVSGSEQMRLTSTGLGIGTSSPAYKLDVAVGNNARALNIAGATTGYSFVQIANSGGQLVWGVGDGSTGALFGGMTAYASAIGSNNATPFQIATNGTIRATLDTSGNLGLGVTPKAWAGGYLGFQIRDAAFASYTSGFTWVGNNWYSDGSNKYIANGNATLYEQTSGKHVWLTAASGTAGNAITFTQAMTLDASGNLLLGTTSSSSQSGTFGQSIRGSNPGVTFIGTEASARTYTIYEGGGALTFFDGTAGTERARIDSSGRFMVGATSVFNSATFVLLFDAGVSNGIVATLVNNTTGAGYAVFIANSATV